MVVIRRDDLAAPSLGAGSVAKANRGEVWIVDLGLAAKRRPCLIISVATAPQDRVLVTVVPRTTSIQGTRFEAAAQAAFLRDQGVFDGQQIVTVPQAKLQHRLGSLSPDQLALVESAVRIWLGL